MKKKTIIISVAVIILLIILLGVKKSYQVNRSQFGSNYSEQKVCKKEEPCDYNQRLSPEWVDIWGTDFPDKILAKEQAWDIIKVNSYLYVTGFILRKEGDSDLFLRKYTGKKELVWEKTWDNGPKDSGLVMTDDGKYLYIGGLTREKVLGKYTNRALLQKYDFDGNLIWTKVWGDIPGGHHEIDGLAIVGNNLYVSHWDSFNGFVKGRSTIKKFTKTDKKGNLGRLIWSQSYGDTDKLTTADGHIYADETGVWIAGRINSYGKIPVITHGDAYLVKFNSNGKQLWIKTFGGKGFDDALSLSYDDKYFYLTGFTQIDISRAMNGMDALIAKFDRNGNKIWEKTVGGNNADYSRAAAVDDKYLYVAYSTRSWGAGEADTILAKYSKINGTLLDYAYWGDKGNDEVVSSLIVDKDFVYMAGKTSSYGQTFDAALIKVSINTPF